MKEKIKKALVDSGKMDELVLKARETLIECGWGEQMAAMARSKYPQISFLFIKFLSVIELIQDQKAASGKTNMDNVIAKLSTDFKKVPNDVRKQIKKEIT